MNELDDKIGQMLLVGFRGLEVAEDSRIIRDIQKRYVGGVLLFDYDSFLQSPVRNIQSPEQVKTLVQSLKDRSSLPLFAAIDQEGGKVNRLKTCFGFPSTVSACYLGQQNRIELTRQYARSTAVMLKELGINLNFAPVVDLNVNPASPAIGKVERSFSEHPEIVIEHARAWIQEHQDHHIVCALKHFPGHGSACGDTHLGYVDVTETWTPDELIPYQRLIQEGLCNMVMTAHIFNATLDPEWPVTLSPSILTGILRRDLRYDSIIISDDMQMKAISSQYSLENAIYQAVSAGVDMLTFGNNLVYQEDIVPRVITIIKQLVATGEISEERIEKSYQRICRVKRLIPDVR